MSIHSVHSHNRADFVTAYNALSPIYGSPEISEREVSFVELEGAGVSDLNLKIRISKKHQVILQKGLMAVRYSVEDLRILASQFHVIATELLTKAGSVAARIADVEKELARARKKDGFTEPFEILEVHAVQNVTRDRIDLEYVATLRDWDADLTSLQTSIRAASARELRIIYTDYAAANSKRGFRGKQIEAQKAAGIIDKRTAHLLDQLGLSPKAEAARLLASGDGRLIIHSAIGPVELLFSDGLIVSKAHISTGVDYFDRGLFFDFVPPWADEIKEDDDLMDYEDYDLLGQTLIVDHIEHRADSLQIDLSDEEELLFLD